VAVFYNIPKKQTNLVTNNLYSILSLFRSVETLRFNKLRITYYQRGQCLSPRTAPASLNRTCALRWCCITFSRVIAIWGCHSGGGVGITCRSPQERWKKYCEDFPLKLHNYSNFGKCQSRYCDDLRRTKKGRPRGASITWKLRPWPLNSLLRVPVEPSQFFMVGWEPFIFMPVSTEPLFQEIIYWDDWISSLVVRVSISVSTIPVAERQRCNPGETHPLIQKTCNYCNFLCKDRTGIVLRN